MEGLRWQLFDTYGNRARIIRAERIQTGGLFGIGATTSFEVTVEVDGRPASRPRVSRDAEGPRRRPGAARRGLAELLADADGADRAGPSAGPAAPVVSTQKPDFDEILGRMAERIGDDALARPALESGPSEAPSLGAPSLGALPLEALPLEALPLEALPVGDGRDADGVPQLCTAPGDLVVLVGLRDHPLRTAWAMAGTVDGGAELRTAGDFRSNGVGHVLIDSPEVTRVQALAAVAGKPLLIAFSIGDQGSSGPQALSSVRPNQLWLVVDAAHKPDDTQAWVRQASWHAAPDAVAVLGSTDTATPGTVNQLGVPVGWVDGYPAASAEL